MKLQQPSHEPVTIWHNPDCSKSRSAIDMLAGLGWVDILVREYLKDPPTADEIRDVLRLLSFGPNTVRANTVRANTVRPRDIMRSHEAPYAANGLENEALTDDQLIDALARFPILLQRPIVIRGERAAVARPNYRALVVLQPSGDVPPIHEVMKSKIKQEGI